MLAFTALSGPPTVRLLGNTPVGFSSLGDAGDCPGNTVYDVIADACVAGQSAQDACNNTNGMAWNSAANSCQNIATGGGSSGGSPSTGHWYDFLIPVATGAAKGLITPTPSPGQVIIAPIAPPWYTQWWGMAAIGVGVLAAGSMLLSKPKASSAVAGLFGIGKRRRRR